MTETPSSDKVLLCATDLHKEFSRSDGAPVKAVDGVSFQIRAGETLGLIGESGSGKSTVGRLVLNLLPADSGSILFDEIELTSLKPAAMRAMRRRIQVVFQEPYGALNPRMNVSSIVGDPLAIHQPQLSRRDRAAVVKDTLAAVGLTPDMMDRHPGALSGGQQQRVGIARAIITQPDFVLLDEPTSSLDLSVRAQILRLLGDLRESFGLTYLFISHDISTVEYFCDQILVMYRGRIVEAGPTSQVLNDPQHGYTKALLSATLSADPRITKEQVLYTQPA